MSSQPRKHPNSHKHIYLHIGLPKTGTTTIQRALKLNEPWLNTQGYFIPGSGIPLKLLSFVEPDKVSQMAFHHNLAWEHFATGLFRRSAGTCRDLAREVSAHYGKHFIVSSEVIAEVSPPQIVPPLLQVANVIVIVYLRRQDLLLQSMYTQRVKHGNATGSFKDVYPRLIKHTPYLHYEAFLERWSKAVGQANIRVSSFDEVVQHSNLIDDFFAKCNLTSTVDFHLPPPDNESPSSKTLALISAIQEQLNAQDNLHLGQNPSHMKVMRAIQAYAQDAGWNTQKAKVLTPEISQAIMSQYADDNRHVAQAYFGRDELFDTPAIQQPPTPFNVEDLSHDDLLNAIAYLCGEYIEDLTRLGDANVSDEQFAVLQAQNQALMDDINAIESTRAWRWVNHYWRLRDRIKALLARSRS